MLDTIGSIADILGGFGAVIAIAFAVKAQRDASAARAGITEERRRLFELEILRDSVARPKGLEPLTF